MRPDTFPVPVLFICMDAIDLECVRVQACVHVRLIHANAGMQTNAWDGKLNMQQWR